MPIWIVNATWLEDEAKVREQWQVNAETVQEAVRDVMAHIRFQPHHVERSCGKGGRQGAVAPLQRSDDYKRNEQSALCRKASQGGIHVARSRTSMRVIRPRSTASRALSTQ